MQEIWLNSEMYFLRDSSKSFSWNSHWPCSCSFSSPPTFMLKWFQKINGNLIICHFYIDYSNHSCLEIVWFLHKHLCNWCPTVETSCGKEYHASKVIESEKPHGPPGREARSREEQTQNENSHDCQCYSHMNEICSHLVNKNLFRSTSEIFTFNPETKTT